jgi:hypothetical protein
MKTSDYIIDKVNRLPRGYVFTYADLSTKVKSEEALRKALGRLVSSGKIAKLSKGKFYKPEETLFGSLVPSFKQVLKDLLESDGKLIGYLTGLSVYNKLGLTTQVSNTIQIGRNDVRSSFKRNQYTISFIKQKNIITKENIPLLQILDVLRYIKKIPDTTIESACKRCCSLVKDMSLQERETMVRLAMKYSPVTRAVLGAILCEIGCESLTEKLYESLNPRTNYRLPEAINALKFAERWHIL